MQCNDLQEMLSAYIDGVLDENEISAVENHIRVCSFCSQELTALWETVKLLNSLGEVNPPGEFRSQLMQRLETMPEEDAKGRGRVDGPKLTGMRQWFRGVDKYLVAAVLMMGLGIGTGLYKLAVATGSQTFDLALGAKAPTAMNTELAGGSTPKQARKEAPETAPEPAMVQITKADSPTTAENSANKPAEPKPDSRVVEQNTSLVIEVGDFPAVTAKISYMIRQAGGFISNSTENLVQPETGDFTLKVPAQNLKEILSELEHLGKVTQRQTQGTVVANDLKHVDESAAYSTIELEIKAPSIASQDKSSSPEALPHSTEAKSGMAGWLLPGALLAAGIGCAVYYFYLRWRKN